MYAYNVKLSVFDNFRKEVKETDICKENYSPELVNSLVISCKENFTEDKFKNLSKIIFVVYDIERKITETTNSGNYQYLSEDDYFQIYSEILFETIMNYSLDKGNFKNYFIKNFRVAFLETKKNGFLRVTGNIKKEKRKQINIITIDSFSESFGEHIDFDSEIFFDSIHKAIDDLPNDCRNLINYAFFSDPTKRKTFKEIQEHFNINKGKVKYTLQKAYDILKVSYPNLLDDMFYGSYVGIMEFPENDTFKKNTDIAA